MIPTLRTNEAEFARVLQQVAAESSRTFPEVVNGQGFALSVRALRNTEKADINQVAIELGQIATRRSVSKKGRVSFRRVYSESRDTLAHRIVFARLKKAGKVIPGAAEMDKMAKRLRGARLKAIAFIRSGWIYPIRQLSRVVGYRDARGQRPRAREGARMTGVAKGYAKPAQRAFTGVVVCEIANTALLHDGGRSPMPVAEKGLARAFAESVTDMRRHLEEKMSGVFRRFNGR